MSIINKLPFVAGAVLIAFATSGAADPKPKNSKAADSQAVANFYAGTSRVWESCKGGVYFGGQFEAQAYCDKGTPSVGLGKWSVKGGVICTDLIWHWKDGDGVGSKPSDNRDCIAHIVDSEGTMWRRWNDDKDWWRVQDIKADKKAAKGFKFKSKVNRMRRKLGV